MDVPAVVGEAFQRSSRSASSTPLRARSKTTQSGGSGRKPVSTIMKALPRASQSRGPSPSHRGQGSVGVDVPVEVHHHQEFHVHDGRTQTITMGVDPVEYGRMVGEAGWGVVCARQKWVVCAGQTLVVCARYFCVILSLYLCNMILFVAFFLDIITQLITVVFFLTSLCGFFVFRLVFRAFSFSSCVAPPLTQLHPSCLTQRTQLTPLISQLTKLISHNSSLTTQLTQLISFNSSHTIQLTQELLSCGIWWSCFRVLSLNFTQVLSHNSSHNSHNSSHTTPLISQFTQLISHNSTHSRAAFVWHLVELLSCPLTELHASSFTQLIPQLTQLISHNSSHLTTHTTHLTQFNSLKSCFCVAFGGAAFVSSH